MRWLSVVSVVVMAFLSGVSSSGESKDGRFFTDSDNVVLGGYDVVAYFTKNEATLGQSEFEAEHEGARFRFSSAEHLAQFEKTPKGFLPQYGGWCAYALGAKNVKFEVDPQTFKLVDGKLYLFYNGDQGNASVPWNQDEANLRGQADRHWSELSAQKR